MEASPKTTAMNYQQTLDYLFAQLPMFQRIGAAAFKKDLTNTLLLCQHLGNPHQKIKTIHIAGTNGKGSTAHAIAAILQTVGYKTGLYISPHYHDFRERIKINGQYIAQKDVIFFTQQNKTFFEAIKPSFFEMTVAMAFWYFEKQKVDIAVIETGLGGRLDSTNVINPLLSIITNISFDHTQFLGNTLPLIAAEKAGIIKPNTPVVIGETSSETEHVFIEKARQLNAPIYFADQQIKMQHFNTDWQQSTTDVLQINPDTKQPELLFKRLQTDLTGSYQALNLSTIIQSALLLPNIGLEKVNLLNIQQALRTVKQQTRFQGRWQLIKQNPTIIADSAHNEAGIRLAIKQILQLPCQTLRIVIGTVADKDIGTILQLLPTNAQYYFCNANIPRALPAETLAQQANDLNLKGKPFGSVKNALQNAQNDADKNDIIFICGSIFVVAEATE